MSIRRSLQNGCGGKTYSEDDRRLFRNLGRNVDVHLKVRRVRSEVVDTSKGAIGSCAERSNAAEY